MKKILALLGAFSIGASLFPAAFWLGDRFLPMSDPNLAQLPPWRWSDEKASLQYCIEQHLPDFDLERGNEKSFCAPITIRAKNGNLVYFYKDGHDGTVFIRLKDTLYLADFSPACSGCSVIALDLTTGRMIWNTELSGIGPTNHKEYSNAVNIETDGRHIIVYGNESHGRYVEILDPATGKTLANRKLDPQTE
jgi:hypothetical protein